MEVRRAALFAVLVASCGGATVAHVMPAGEAGMTPASDTAGAWPQQLDPRWPARCLIENAAVHPREPWIAVACTASEPGHGAVLVFDATTGRLRSSTPIEDFVGWDDAGLLRWHPDGVRLGTNLGTNGIALLDRAQYVGAAFPDQLRDSGVGYVWIDDRMFTDTGALFEIQRGDWRFEFDELEVPQLQAIEWNAAGTFVVGVVGTGIAAYDPIARRMVYEKTAADLGARGQPSWSPDGRRCVYRSFAVPPAPDELLFVDGDTGRVLGVEAPSSPRTHHLVWGPSGSLAVVSYVHHVGRPSTQHRVDVFRDGARRTVIELGAHSIQASSGVVDAHGLAWSPAEDGLALLLDEQVVQVVDPASGRVRASFAAPAPAIPAGLPDHYATGQGGLPGALMWTHGPHLIRIAPHFVSIWTTDGAKVAEFVVPTT